MTDGSIGMLLFGMLLLTGSIFSKTCTVLKTTANSRLNSSHVMDEQLSLD